MMPFPIEGFTMQTLSRLRRLTGPLPVLVLAVWTPGASGVLGIDTARDTVADAQPVAPGEISRLVGQLGSQHYAQREKAQAQLRQLGLDAFDALYAAQNSDDIEISMRARYLLQSLTIRWAHDDDPLPVRELLKGYDGKADDERYNLMEQLISLNDNQGITALCRLVRFDTSNLLSKRAALLVMRRAAVDDEPQATSLADTIHHALGASRREAADWLQTYARTLREPEATLDTWQRLVQQEEQTFQQTPEQSSATIVRDLLRWQAELLERCGRDEQTLAVILKSVQLLDGTRQQLLETVDWLIARGAWSTIERVAERFQERFDESPLLLYRLAEAQRKSGRTEQSQQTADRALAADPNSPTEHVEAAIWVQERGLFDWSEREYRRVIQTTPTEAQENLEARFNFSEMLHDLSRDLEAAQLLEEAVPVLESNENARRAARRSAEGVQSRMHYFFAEHFRQQGDPDQQLEHLRLGVQADPDDADVLIAMYRESERSPERRKQTLARIEQAALGFRERIAQYEQLADQVPDEKYRADVNMAIAAVNNQLAWLISNTEGDYQYAVRCSRRSLELRPETAGYLDTLGRCYYAAGDLDQAIAVQSRAVELEPHTHQIRRQLEMFQQAKQADQ
jgi:tetratricopeptide (TPR) repeat protein